MQQKFTEIEQPIQSLPVQKQTEPQKQEALSPTRKRLGRKKKDTLQRAQVFLLRTGAYGSLGLASLSILLAGTFLLFMIGSSAWEHFHPTFDTQFNLPGWQIALNVAMLLTPFAIGSGIFYGVGRKVDKWATHLESNLPVQNAGDLSASETLMRASAEPLQEPQAVLLRATTETPEKHTEQLLRATERP